MMPKDEDKPHEREYFKFTQEENMPEVTPEQEIKVLEGLLRRCEQEEDYETAAAAYEMIQELKEKETM